MKNKSITITIVTALIVGVGGFFGGMQYQKSKSPTPPGFGNMSAAGRAQFGNRTDRGAGMPGGGGFTLGSIVSMDDKSITVKDQSGSTKIVYFSDSTKIGKQTDGSKSDLDKDQNVTVSGKPNSDDSLTAESIQIRPAQN